LVGQFKGKRKTDVDQPKNISSVICSKWSNDSVQDKYIEKDIECIGYEDFDQVRNKISIRVSRGGLNTFYPFARGPQYNLIWAINETKESYYNLKIT
jgi:hypothetical protein